MFEHLFISINLKKKKIKSLNQRNPKSSCSCKFQQLCPLNSFLCCVHWTHENNNFKGVYFTFCKILRYYGSIQIISLHDPFLSSKIGAVSPYFFPTSFIVSHTNSSHRCFNYLFMCNFFFIQAGRIVCIAAKDEGEGEESSRRQWWTQSSAADLKNNL